MSVLTWIVIEVNKIDQVFQHGAVPLEAEASAAGALFTAFGAVVALVLLAITFGANRRLLRLEYQPRPQLEADSQFFEIARIVLDHPALYEFYITNENDKAAWRTLSSEEKKLYVFGELIYFRLSYIYREYLNRRIKKQYWANIEGFVVKMSRSPDFIRVHKHSGKYFEPEFYELVERLRSLTLVLRPLTASNFARALRIGRRIFPGDGFNLFLHYLQTFLPRRLRSPENRSAIQYSRYFVARLDGKAVGITGIYELTQQPGEAWLGWFGVMPHERGAGLGRELLARTEQVARDAGYSVLRAWTTNEPASERARTLYEQAGFAASETAFRYDGAPVTVFSKSLSAAAVHPYAGSMKKAFVGCLDHIAPTPDD